MSENGLVAVSQSAVFVAFTFTPLYVVGVNEKAPSPAAAASLPSQSPDPPVSAIQVASLLPNDTAPVEELIARAETVEVA
jgi:hypothetical protein